MICIGHHYIVAWALGLDPSDIGHPAPFKAMLEINSFQACHFTQHIPPTRKQSRPMTHGKEQTRSQLCPREVTQGLSSSPKWEWQQPFLQSCHDISKMTGWDQATQLAVKCEGNWSAAGSQTSRPQGLVGHNAWQASVKGTQASLQCLPSWQLTWCDLRFCRDSPQGFTG